MTLALAVGTTLLGSDFPELAERVEVETGAGPVSLLDAGAYLVLQRHGLGRYRAPHAIDHRANMLALAERGVDRVLAICSSGSLRAELEVGSFVCPDDFFAPYLGQTLYDDERGHLAPALDPELRRRILDSWSTETEALRDGGVYAQTPGPRFETPAEVRMLAQHADVVGMTMASECVLANELGIRYAAICTVDNYANGLGVTPPTPLEIAANLGTTRAALLPALDAVTAALA